MDNLSPNSLYQHPKCFARTLNNCSKKISGEHIISDSILKFLFPENSMYLTGPRWLHNQKNVKFPINTLKAKVLCITHNSALSQIDSLMKSFVQFIFSIEENQSGEISISVYDIERWMLKVLCAFTACGSLHYDFSSWNPPYSWLEILFHNKKIDPGMGLYFLSKKSPFNVNTSQIGFAPIRMNEQGVITGLCFDIAGTLFLFLIEPLTQQVIDMFSDYDLVYRPKIITMNFGASHKTINLGSNTENIVQINILNKLII
jgi:hypothetical protein